MTGKDMGDAIAGGAAIGSYLHFLPEVAALLAIIWTSIRIYEWVRFRICGLSDGRAEVFK